MFFRFGQKPPPSVGVDHLNRVLVESEKAAEQLAADLAAFGLGQVSELPLVEVTMVRSPKDLATTLAAAAKAILKILEKDGRLRELYSDLLHKLGYLTAVTDGLTSLMDQARKLERSEPHRFLENLSRLIREFLAVEASFAEHKSLDTWHRLKSEAARRLTSKQYAWLSAFYMNFSMFAALTATAGTEATAILDELAKLLATGASDKQTLVKALKLGVQAIRCIRRMMHGLTALLKALAKA